MLINYVVYHYKYKYTGLLEMNLPLVRTWFPRPPDLTPCDYLFCKYVKKKNCECSINIKNY